MFHGMDAKEACGDLFEYGVKDDNLSLIYEANKKVVMNVKAPQGTSQSYTLTDRIMQGNTWAPAMASAQVDSFGKQMIEEEPSFMFMLKEVVHIPLLGKLTI